MDGLIVEEPVDLWCGLALDYALELDYLIDFTLFVTEQFFEFGTLVTLNDFNR